MSYKIGEKFPNYSFIDANGNEKSIYDYLTRDYLIIFFYPKDFTLICTKEVCHFRDNYEKLDLLNTSIIGISSDDPESHEKFRSKFQLPFDLVTDKFNQLSSKLGIKKVFGFHTGRETYVLLKDATIIFKYRSDLTAKSHVLRVLDVIKNHKM